MDDYSKDAKQNALKETVRRIARENDSKLGYSGFGGRFEEYIFDPIRCLLKKTE